MTASDYGVVHDLIFRLPPLEIRADLLAILVVIAVAVLWEIGIWRRDG